MTDLTISEMKKKIKESRPEWVDQALRPVPYQGTVVPGYMVAKDGLIISYKVSEKGRPLAWTMRSKTQQYPAVSLYVPPECVDFYNEDATSYNGVTVLKRVNIHILVADAWLDTENNCPEDLEPWWHYLPLELKETLRPYFQIDHIDGDKCNPHLSNLRFTSSRTNNKYRKLFTLGPNAKETLEIEEKMKQLMRDQRKKHA